MAVDIAKVYIDAEDRTNAAWESAGRNLGGFMDKVKAARGALAGIGTALGAAAGLTAIVEQSVRARAEMHDLSEMTGITVERLSQIKPVAEAAGKSLDDVAEAIAKFDKFVQAARNDPGSNQADLLKKLGIDADKSRTADQMLDQFIKRMGEYGASIGKTAAYQEAMGKSGARMASVIKDVNEAGTQAVKVSSAQAAEAETVEKNIRKLSISFKEQRDHLGGEFIPAVSAVTQALLQMREEAARSNSQLATLLGIPLREWAAMGAIGLASLVDVLRATWYSVQLLASGAGAVVISLGAMGNAAIAAGLAISGNLVESKKYMDKAMAGFADSGRFMKDAWAEFQASVKEPTFTSKVLDNLVEAERRVDGVNAAAKQGGKDFPTWGTAGAAALSKQIAIIQKRIELAGAERDTLLNLEADQIQRLLADEEYFHAASIHGEEEYINSKADLQRRGAQVQLQLARNAAADQQKALEQSLALAAPKTPAEAVAAGVKILDQRIKLVAATQAVTKAERDLADVEKQRGQALVVMDVHVREHMVAIARETEDYTRALEQQIDDMRHQVDVIGESEVAQKKANLEYQLTTKLKNDILKVEREIQDLERNKGDSAEIAARRRQIDQMTQDIAGAIRDGKQAIEAEFDKNWSANLGRSISDALWSGGKDAAPKIRKAIEDALKQPFMIATQAAAKSVVESVFQGFGFSPSQIAGWSPFSTSNTSDFGPVQGFSLANNTWGGNGGMASNAFGGAGTGYAVGTAAHSLFGNDRNAQGMSVGGTIGGAIGSIWGPIGTLIGSAIGSAIGSLVSSGGGPKTGGSFFGSYSGMGTYQSDLTPTLDLSHHLQDEKNPQAIAAERVRVQGFASEVGRLLSAFGGSSPGFQLGAGYNIDSAGTAPSMVSTLLRSASGQTLLEQSNRNVGRSEEEVNTEIQLQGKRAILAALQASDLPDAISRWLHGATAATASADAIDRLVNGAAAVKGLIDEGKQLDIVMAQLSGNSIAQFTAGLDVMNSRVERAQKAFADAFTAGDPQQFYASEQELKQAIVQRYQSEIDMVRSLQQAIRQLDQEAYQFALNIAQKINSVGGSRDIGGIAMGRATTLRAGIGGNAPTNMQLEDLNNYVGAIDTWYQTRRAQIERDMQAQIQAQQAIYQAQAAAAQSRVTQLQAELAIANQFQGVLDRTRQMIDDMRLSSANPMSVFGRLAMAGGDVAGLKETYKNATGQDRIDAANKLLDALQTQRGLGQEAYQRASPEWQALYNSIMADLNMVQGDSKTVAEQAVEIQRQILLAQNQAAMYQAMAASATQVSSADLDSLNLEAKGYYEYAEKEGARLYATQRREHQEQLDAITGGTEIEIFVAQKQKEAVDLLKSINERVGAFLDAIGGATTATTPADTGSNTAGGGNSSDNPAARGEQRIVLTIDGRVLGDALIPTIDRRVSGPLLSTIRRGITVS